MLISSLQNVIPNPAIRLWNRIAADMLYNNACMPLLLDCSCITMSQLYLSLWLECQKVNLWVLQVTTNQFSRGKSFLISAALSWCVDHVIFIFLHVYSLWASLVVLMLTSCSYKSQLYHWAQWRVFKKNVTKIYHMVVSWLCTPQKRIWNDIHTKQDDSSGTACVLYSQCVF